MRELAAVLLMLFSMVGVATVTEHVASKPATKCEAPKAKAIL